MLWACCASNAVRVKQRQSCQSGRDGGNGRKEDVQSRRRADVDKPLQETLKLRSNCRVRENRCACVWRREFDLENRIPDDGEVQDGSEAVRKTGDIHDEAPSGMAFPVATSSSAASHKGETWYAAAMETVLAMNKPIRLRKVW